MEFIKRPRIADGEPFEQREPLRSNGRMTYRELIDTLKYLWGESHPDIPLLPHTGPHMDMSPAIVYTLQLRKPFKDEPKVKVRGMVTDPETGEAYRITGQRFNNIIQFAAITEDDPVMAEDIIELFEDFIHDHTDILKANGLSDLFYGRRIPDDEFHRRGEDKTIRGVAYDFVLEKVRQEKVSRLEEIALNVRIHQKDTSDFFSVPTGGDGEFIHTEVALGYNVGDRVIIYPTGNPNQFLPNDIHSGWPYVVISSDNTVIGLKGLKSDEPINNTSGGAGRIAFWLGAVDIRTDLEENLATPNY